MILLLLFFPCLGLFSVSSSWSTFLSILPRRSTPAREEGGSTLPVEQGHNFDTFIGVTFVLHTCYWAPLAERDLVLIGTLHFIVDALVLKLSCRFSNHHQPRWGLYYLLSAHPILLPEVSDASLYKSVSASSCLPLLNIVSSDCPSADLAVRIVAFVGLLR